MVKTLWESENTIDQFVILVLAYFFNIPWFIASYDSVSSDEFDAWVIATLYITHGIFIHILHIQQLLNGIIVYRL